MQVLDGEHRTGSRTNTPMGQARENASLPVVLDDACPVYTVNSMC